MNKEERREIDLMEYWRVIVRRKNIVFVFAGALIVLVGIYSFTVPPKYKPTATLLIGEETSKLLNLDDEFGGPMAYRARSQLQELVYVNTQLTLLKSVSLARRVAEKMDLVNHPKYNASEGGGNNITAKLKDFVTLKWLRSGKNADDDQMNMNDPYIDISLELQDRLKVSQIRDTEIITVGFVASDPVLGTQIVNTFADEFINYSIDVKYKTTQQAKDFLSEQISGLRDELNTKERELQRYSQEKDLRFLSDSESAALSEYSELHRAFAAAQVERINAQAMFRELRNLDIDAPLQVVSNPVIQNLATEYSRMKNEYEELRKVYGPNHPDMIKRKASLDSMKTNLQSEVHNAVSIAQTAYRTALGKENDLKSALKRAENDVARMDSDKILYNSLRIEVENIRGQLISLEEMKKEAEVSTQLAGIKATNIRVVDYALVPQFPSSPKKKLNLLLALLMGISGGIALCFLIETMDNTVKGADDLERLTGLPSLGMIPLVTPDGEKKTSSDAVVRRIDSSPEKEMAQANANIELINHRHPNLAIAEDYRTVRTSILLSQNNKMPKVIAFSSSMPQEGKTVTVANTAIAFAQLGKKVVVVDADLRRPRLHRLFDARNTKGLTGFLSGQNSVEEIVQKTSVENIWLISSGPIPPNPAELLESDQMRSLIKGIQKEIDFVLIDTPPVLAVVDTVIIGSIVGNVILIAQPEKTSKKALVNSVDRLKQSDTKIIGVIFNKTNLQTKKYHDKYYYYQEYYSSQGEA
jgi:capsular exopolysaccharide synthesis family protein